MLSGCVKALDSLPFLTLKTVLLPMIQTIWPNLCSIITGLSNDIEIVAYICNLM